MADTYTNDTDSITGAQQAQYQVNGLNYISDNQDIIPRDLAGNIILIESGSDNALLIINPVAEQVTTKSVLRVVNTRFQYYKFPATTRIIDQDIFTGSLDIEIPDLTTTIDPIYARYKPSINYIKAPESQFSGTLMDVVVDGAIQSEINNYTITKEIKNSGSDLRFRIKMHHFYKNVYGYADTQYSYSGTLNFSIIKSGPNTPVNLQYATFSTSDGTIPVNQFRDTELDLVLPNNTFEIGDKYSIGIIVAEQGHEVIAEQTYWVITDASKNVDEWNQEI